MKTTKNERIDALKSEAAQLVPTLMQVHGNLQKNAEVKLQRAAMDILTELTAYVADLSKRVSELEKKMKLSETTIPDGGYMVSPYQVTASLVTWYPIASSASLTFAIASSVRHTKHPGIIMFCPRFAGSSICLPISSNRTGRAFSVSSLASFAFIMVYLACIMGVLHCASGITGIVNGGGF